MNYEGARSCSFFLSIIRINYIPRDRIFASGLVPILINFIHLMNRKLGVIKILLFLTKPGLYELHCNRGR